MSELAPAVIGAAAGLRTFTSPAAVSRAAAAGLMDLEKTRLRLLTGHKTSKFLLGVALAELASDKAPFTPSRLEPVPLGARALSGALCGAAVNANRKRSIWKGALIGAGAAVGAALAGYHIRRALVRECGLPDLTVALAEDCVALTLAFAATALVKPTTREQVLQGWS